MKSRVAVLATVIAVLLPSSSPARLAPAAAPRPIYARPYPPKIPMAWLALPPGAVQPEGWLRDWAEAARHGITGHLDERHPTFAEGWKGVPIHAPGANRDGTGWPLEQCAYWLDGALRLGFVLHDQALIRKIRARLDPIVAAVNRADSGVSFIYWKKGYKPQGFNGWAHSQLGRALVALYAGTGDPRVLKALVKVYADYPVARGGLSLSSVSGLCNLEAMLDTYSYSGERRILGRALQALARPEIARIIRPWGQGDVPPAHTVILYEDLRLPALVYPWSGNARYLQQTLGAFRWLEEYNLLPYGVSSGEEYVSGIGAFRKTETCDVSAMLHTTSRLYRIQGDGAWGDRMERAFLNAGAGPIARDWQTMCYYQSPNRLRSDSLPCAQPLCPGPEGIRFHRLGCPTVLCCVGSVNRIIPTYVMDMWMATWDDGLAATLYGPCKVTALAGARVPVSIRAMTDYPFGEGIRMVVKPERTVAFPLYLRIPGWCVHPGIAVNGSALKRLPRRRGFVKIAREWSAGDVVELRLPMRPRVSLGCETQFPLANRRYFGFEPAQVFQPRRLPYASVFYGPLLFSLPIPDLNPNTPQPHAKWQYALDANPAQRDFGITVERKPMPAHWDWPLHAPLVLRVPARGFDWHPTDAQALPNQPVKGDASATVPLVPYGCTKFRISMFPVTPRSCRAPELLKGPRARSPSAE